MAFAFDNKIQIWRTRIQTGPVGTFIRWWLGELRQLLPLHWQEKLQHALRRVTLSLENGEIILGVEENRHIRPLDQFSGDQDVPLQRQQITDLLVEKELLEVPRFYLLAADTVLRKELLLPEAAEANLHQVLTFEMDRQTPFRAADVYFDWRVAGHNKETSQIRVEIFVTQREGVDAACQLLSARGLAPGGVDIIEDGQSLGLNLLPPEQRVRVVNRKVRLNYGLAALTLVLLVLVMAQSLFLRAHQVTELETAISEVRDEARHVQRIKDQIRDTSEAAGFLTQRRSATPLSVEILADVTAILPDDTHLDRLVFGQASVQLQGKSQNAQQLIELVNKSELLQDAAFRGSTRLDARTGLEVFEVNAVVTGAEGAEDGGKLMALAVEQGNSRLTAILLFVIAVMLVYLLGFHWFILRHVEYGSEISGLSDQLVRFQQVASQRAFYEEQLQRLQSRRSDDNLFLEEGDFNEAAAAMSERLSQMVSTQADESCQIVSRQPVRSRVEERFERVTVNVRMRCEIEDIMQILYSLETRVPMIIADELTIIKPRTRRRTTSRTQVTPDALDIRFNMHGYLRPGLSS